MTVFGVAGTGGEERSAVVVSRGETGDRNGVCIPWGANRVGVAGVVWKRAEVLVEGVTTEDLSWGVLFAEKGVRGTGGWDTGV